MTPSNTASELPVDAQAVATGATSAIRPIYWSVRRELWENRSIWLAPLVVAALVVFGFLISATTLAQRMRDALALDPVAQREALIRPYDIAAALMIITAFVVGAFYCLDALYGERRDRSILFWKSLPVSDLTTVLSKASIPLVVLPLIAFAAAVCTQLIMLLVSTAVLQINDVSTAPLWGQVLVIQRAFVLLYGLSAMALWQAPIYAWLLLVSGWARRAPLVWAVVPVVAVCAVEQFAFNTSYVISLLEYRLYGSFTEAFGVSGQTNAPINPLPHLDPLRFLSTPGLWIGLAFAAGCLAAAARLRRYREPI